MKKQLIVKAKEGFSTLQVNKKYIDVALENLEAWLTDDELQVYVPQIEYLINNKYWDYLLDSFYQVIPFGTGGRRGEVGIGPNRINLYTIMASAQGHSQYLLKKHSNWAKASGVVLAYDVREFFGNKYFSPDLPNPVNNLKSKDLAEAAASVYTANGLKVFIFDAPRTTPELSFAIRELKAAAGAMFSASHNPPEHNGKKVFDLHGGQLIPPNDEELVFEVTANVHTINRIDYSQALAQGLITILPDTLDDKYISAATSVSMSQNRDIRILFTSLHGCGLTSVYKALTYLGFQIIKDPLTCNYSGRFENVTFNIPNPEVVQSFDTSLKFAETIDVDIIMSSDPDADRVGIMVKHQGKWNFLNGNEIAGVLTNYAIKKSQPGSPGNSLLQKTTVTTNLITNICKKNNVQVEGELLIGFKYIADIMNDLEAKGRINEFLFGCEESHGYIAGNYSRDKDAVVPAIWLAELAGNLKKEGKTLIDYLNETYATYGYFRNYLTEIRMLGATGQEKIHTIQKSLRANPPTQLGAFKVQGFEDCLMRLPILSETDAYSKDVLIFELTPNDAIESLKVVVRPSGTEPKIKIYIEIGAKPCTPQELQKVIANAETVLASLEKAVMDYCYKLIGVDFPDRGYLLFWQLPLDLKLKYFELESKIEHLKNLPDKQSRSSELFKLLGFLGADPLAKVNKAFKAKYHTEIEDYLEI